jgi:hypothetical protein
MPLEPVATPLFTPEELAQNEIRKRAMVDLFVSEETVLVIGAGCSVRLKYPTWPALLSKLAALAAEVANDHGAEFHPDETHVREDPLRYAGWIKAFIQRCDVKLDKYYGFLSGEFGEKEIDPFHRLLVKIPSRGILTTNYDPSLDLALMTTDRSMMTADRALVIEDDSARRVSEFLASLNRDSGIPRRIAHLHGRYDRPKSIILTEADYVDKYHSRLNDAQRGAIRDVFRDGMAGQQAVSVDGLIDQLESAVPPWSLHRKLLWSILATRRVVFIGFSLNDPYLGQMLALVADDLWRWKEAHHFAIMALSEVGTTQTKLEAEQFRRKYAVGVVFYENREAQRHQGLDSLVEEIANACGVAAESKLEDQPASVGNSAPAPKPGPEWVDRNNRIMKQRATNDAD